MSSVSAADTPSASGARPDLDNDCTTDDGPDLLGDIREYYADRPALIDTCVHHFGRDDNNEIIHEALDCPISWKESLKDLTKTQRRAKLQRALHNLGFDDELDDDSESDPEKIIERQVSRMQRVQYAVEMLGYYSSSDEESDASEDEVECNEDESLTQGTDNSAVTTSCPTSNETDRTG